MLKKKALRRIFLTTIVFFIVFVVYSLRRIDEKPTIYESNTIKTNFTENIYTLNKDNYISKTSIYVNKDLTVLEKVKVLIETMIEENNNNVLLPSYFKPILPVNTKILNVMEDNDLIQINFSKELLNITEEQSEKMIEAITYTLTDIDGINGIEIYVDNQLLKYIPNTNKDLPTLLTREFGINKIYNITTNNDITKVVIYFLGTNDSNYIPVTKYVNDKREKIEIIVENLTNQIVVESNLISLLDDDIKLSDYEINDNAISLEFNEYMYNDVEKKTLNNDFANLISYSIFDSYDVEKVVFFQNNEKILEKTRKNIE